MREEHGNHQNFRCVHRIHALETGEEMDRDHVPISSVQEESANEELSETPRRIHSSRAYDACLQEHGGEERPVLLHRIEQELSHLQDRHKAAGHHGNRVHREDSMLRNLGVMEGTHWDMDDGLRAREERDAFDVVVIVVRVFRDEDV